MYVQGPLSPMLAKMFTTIQPVNASLTRKPYFPLAIQQPVLDSSVGSPVSITARTGIPEAVYVPTLCNKLDGTLRVLILGFLASSGCSVSILDTFPYIILGLFAAIYGTSAIMDAISRRE